MEHRHAAIIVVGKEEILNWLQFEGGVIHDIWQNQNEWNPNEINIKIEHPDLDSVEVGYSLRRINPEYYYQRNGRFYKIVRIDPPRGKPLPRTKPLRRKG